MRQHRHFEDILRALRFPVYLISGRSLHDGRSFRVLYGGSDPTRAYLSSLAFSDVPSSTFLGKQTHYGFMQHASKLKPDLEFTRSHRLLLSFGAFSRHLFVPDWVSGYSDLSRQVAHESQSKSRQRDRHLIARNGIDFTVTTETSALNHFYDAMYVPHIRTAHGESALFMSREQMLRHVQQSSGELVVIRSYGRAVAGSFVVYEREMPRLYSGGVLERDRNLLRQGVGVAIYLLTFDHLLSRGFARAHMGRTRPFLSDGGLYFKQRFGLTVSEASNTGLLLKLGAPTSAAVDFLRNNGLLHYRNGELRAALMTSDEHGDQPSRQASLANALGVRAIDTLIVSEDSISLLH